MRFFKTGLVYQSGAALVCWTDAAQVWNSIFGYEKSHDTTLKIFQFFSDEPSDRFVNKYNAYLHQQQRTAVNF